MVQFLSWTQFFFLSQACGKMDISGTSFSILILLLCILGAFPDAFKFQENLKKLREMLQEPTLRELFKKSINPDLGCSVVFKAVVCTSTKLLFHNLGSGWLLVSCCNILCVLLQNLWFYFRTTNNLAASIHKPNCNWKQNFLRILSYNNIPHLRKKVVLPWRVTYRYRVLSSQNVFVFFGENTGYFDLIDNV